MWIFQPATIDIASGKATVDELENGPVEIVDFPIQNGDFLVRKLFVYSPRGHRLHRLIFAEYLRLTMGSWRIILAVGVVIFPWDAAQPKKLHDLGYSTSHGDEACTHFL